MLFSSTARFKTRTGFSTFQKPKTISLSGSPPKSLPMWLAQHFLYPFKAPKWQPLYLSGRNLTRECKIQKMTLAPGKIAAQIQNGKGLISCSINVEILPAATWEQLFYEVSLNAYFQMELLQDNFPKDFDPFLRSNRIYLIPSKIDHFDFECDCMERRGPCKHTFAAAYLFTKHLNLDPFLLFILRGNSKSNLLEFLQKDWKRGKPQTTEHPRRNQSLPAADINEFWLQPPMNQIHLPLDPFSPSIPDSDIKKLGPAPLQFDQVTLDQLLGDAYQFSSDFFRQWAHKSKSSR